MTDEQLIAKAVTRWGKKDPSPDDVLMERWPRYHEDREHTEGYHRMAREVTAECTIRRECCRCGGPLVDRPSNAKYCKGCLKENQKGARKQKLSVSPERVTLMCEDYRNGMPPAKVARKYHCSPSTVTKYLKQRGVELRGNRAEKVEPRICQQCDKAIPRRSHEGPSSYRERKFCSTECHYEHRRQETA